MKRTRQAALATTEFVAFDLETTGLHATFAQIVEIGAVRFLGNGTVLERFEQLINPGIPIPREVTKIHGITDRMVRSAPRIHEVLPQFFDFLGTSHLALAHNARFDVSFVACAAQRHSMELPPQQVLDTCDWAKLQIHLSSYRLDVLGQELGVAETSAHRALADAELLQAVFLQLLTGRCPPKNLADLVNQSPPLRFDQFALRPQATPPGCESFAQAIARGQAISIRYEGGSTPGTLRWITPLSFMQTNGVVYVVARCHQSDCEKTFRVDRISQIESEA